MHVSIQSHWLAKAGNTPDEYEDAFWPDWTERDTVAFRVAIADGATETSFSRQWAKLLVRSYYGVKTAHQDLCQILPKIQKAWRRSVPARPLPWYAEAKLQLGAYSSLVGLMIREKQSCDEANKWEAIAVGDSCLFQVRDNQLLIAWPLSRSDQFNNRPLLISSKPENNTYLAEQIARLSGDWESGDLFYLMTDALACWFLQMLEQGSVPGEVIPDFDRRAFPEWIATLRESKQIRNDDVTLVAVRVA